MHDLCFQIDVLFLTLIGWSSSCLWLYRGHKTIWTNTPHSLSSSWALSSSWNTAGNFITNTLIGFWPFCLNWNSPFWRGFSVIVIVGTWELYYSTTSLKVSSLKMFVITFFSGQSIRSKCTYKKLQQLRFVIVNKVLSPSKGTHLEGAITHGENTNLMTYHIPPTMNNK